MFWIAAYVVFVAYAAGVFTYAVTHDRRWAAIGILLSISGFQLTVMGTIRSEIGTAVALVGLASVGRDVVSALLPRIAPAIVRTTAGSERA